MKKIFIFLLCSIVLFQCTKDEDLGQSGNVKIPKTTKIFSEDDVNNYLEEISNDKATFYFNSNISKSKQLKVNDILVIPSEDGFLKKVSQIKNENNQVILSTIDATLTEAIEKGDCSFEESFTTAEVLAFSKNIEGISIDSIKLKSANGIQMINFNIDAILYDKDGNHLSRNDQVRIYGSFQIFPSISGKFSFDNYEVELIKVDFKVSEQLNLGLDAGYAIQSGLFEKKFGTLKFPRFIVYVGIPPAALPVYIRPELDIFGGVKIDYVGELKTSFSQEYTGTFSMEYYNSNWNSNYNKNENITASKPTVNAGVKTKVYLRPKLKMKIYGTVSPYLDTEAYCEFDALLSNDPWWKLYGGLYFGAGVNTRIFGKNILDFSTKYFDLRLELLNAGSSSLPPVANFTASKTSINKGETIQFADQSTNSPTSWLWNFGDGSTSTSQNPSKTYSTVGTYTVSLRATNSYGNNTKTMNITVNETGGTNETSSFTDSRDGKIYKTVKIGTQWWMAENLAYLPSVYPPSSVSSTESRYYVYNYNGSNVATAKQQANYSTYGVLYNWEAAKAACPPGWHLPTDVEWKQLEMALGMTQAQADASGKRGTDQGSQMKSISGWTQNGNGKNTSGFDGKPSGYTRHDGSGFALNGDVETWWTTTNSATNSKWCRYLFYNYSNVERNPAYFSTGLSVRCIKDNEANTFTDSRDGKSYKTVKIGNQEWMAENLAYLPSVSPPSTYSNTNPYYYVYGYNGGSVATAKQQSNYTTYGVLYNWPAAKVACPSGWHLPSDAEWKQLEMSLGMTQAQADATGKRGTDQGTQMKAISGWNSNGNGTNSSGFTALPAGYLSDDTNFLSIGLIDNWWSSSENNSTNAWYRGAHYDYNDIYRDYTTKLHGFSVRCLKD